MKRGPKLTCSCDEDRCRTCHARKYKATKRAALKRMPLKRSGPIARKAAVKVKRSKPRRGPMRDKGYRKWLEDRRCVACVAVDPVRAAHESFYNRNDPAHTVGNGMKSKGPDSSCIPLCRHHHDEMDGRLSTAITTKEQFAAKYGIDLKREAESHYLAYQISKETEQ